MDERPRRRRRTMSEARDLVSAWRSSGQPKESWCRTQGILRSTLLSCLSRVDEADRTPSSSGFIEVRPARPDIPEPSPLSPLVLELGPGIRLVGLDAASVMALVRALRQDPA